MLNMRVLWIGLSLLTGLFWAAPSGQTTEDPLLKTQDQTHRLLEDEEKDRLDRYHELQQLRQDLRYIADELSRELVGEPQNLAGYSKGALERLKSLRHTGRISSQLDPVLQRLEKIFLDFPNRQYAQDYAPSLMRAISRELYWAAAEGRDTDEILSLLDKQLLVPEKGPDAPTVEIKGLFPEDRTVEQFKKQGAIIIFLAKHRWGKPSSYVKTTAEAIKDGLHHVQIGVEITGPVHSASYAKDQDYCFDIGPIHIEITPEWRLTHPKLHLPRNKEITRVRGWTYYDIFHTDEIEFEASHPTLGEKRATVWEIHPAQEIEVVIP